MSEEHTPAYKIYHYYFRVQVPAAFAFRHQQELLGVYQYESKEQERHAGEEMVHRQHTVAEMVDLWQDGAELILTNPKDSLKIYEWIREHIQRKMNRVQTSLNTGNIPLKDLQALDDFATYVYRVARNYEGRVDLQSSSMNQKIDRFFGDRSFNRFKEVPNASEESHRRVVPEHDPMSEEISRTALERQLPHK